MKKILIALALVGLLSAPAFADGYYGCENIEGQYKNSCSPKSDHYEKFDQGLKVDLVLLETKNTEWGAGGSYFDKVDETRIWLFGKIYLNRILGFGKK